MELGGDEKRIQALFSELSLENQSRVPQFAHVWTRAVTQKSTLRRAVAPLREKTFLNPLLISALVIATVCSLAVWTWYSFTQTPNIANQLPPSVTFEAPYTPTPVKLQPGRTEPRHQKHSARRRQVDRTIATEAALLSIWQSPTQQFMTSPTDLALGSLPVLNQSAKDLESFLSKNSEIMKESNR
jgi:hypothetical protein